MSSLVSTGPVGTVEPANIFLKKKKLPKSDSAQNILVFPEFSQLFFGFSFDALISSFSPASP